VSGVLAEQRQAAAHGWLQHAAFEHASVAAFAKLTLDLIALGAPPDLIVDAQRAGLDEVRHAKLGYGIASAYAGEALGPGPLRRTHLALGTSSFESLVRDTYDGGCCGETVAAAIALAARDEAADSVLRGVLSSIANDEQRHAALGWRVLAWATRQSTAARTTLEELLDQPPADDGESSSDPGSLAKHGLLDASYESTIENAIMTQVVGPCARALLDACARRGTLRVG